MQWVSRRKNDKKYNNFFLRNLAFNLSLANAILEATDHFQNVDWFKLIAKWIKRQ